MSRGFKIALIVFATFVLFATCIGPGVLFVPVMLVSGWIPAATRLFNGWNPGASTVGWAVMAMVLIAGTQLFLGWLYRNLKSQVPGAPQRRWRLRWTMAGYAALMCVLVAVTSLILITHQIYWMAKGQDPIFSDGIRDKIFSFRDASALLKLAEDVKWDSAKTRAAFFDGTMGQHFQVPAENLQPVWIEGTGNTLSAVILIPRHPMVRERARFFVLRPQTNLVVCTLDKLPDVLASFGIERGFGGSSRAGGLLP